MKYDYMENLKGDIKEYIKENKEYLEGKNEQELYDILFLEDSITGNAEEIAIEKYNSGEFVLEPGEVSYKQMLVCDDETQEQTSWFEF